MNSSNLVDGASPHLFLHLCHFIADTNECDEGTHLCEQTCENTNGSYTCICDNDNTVIANDQNNCLGMNDQS